MHTAARVRRAVVHFVNGSDRHVEGTVGQVRDLMSREIQTSFPWRLRGALPVLAILGDV